DISDGLLLDLSRAGEIAVTVTLIGAIDDGGPILRSRAKAGEALCVTGSLGGARYGLELLRSGLWRRGGSPEPGGDAAVRERLALRHLRPRARVDAGRVLARMGASAMIDISDGLLLDLSRLLAASGAGCLVDPSEVPVDPDLAAIEAARPGAFPDPLHAALSGGEDFELLFSIDDARLDEVASSLAEVGSPVTRIGTVTDGPPMVGGRALDEWKDTGWDHLREA
ncbi:MAG: hypothetical protein H0U16_03650, partial [Actinobacteria bacterium]|nr:hypothetical protein [Actinomycetota bacterium]